MDWTSSSFLRQLFVSTGPWTVFFMDGLSVGLPTVLIPQLRKENQTVTIDEASWLMAIHPYTGVPWMIVLSILITVIGRKKSHIFVCINALIGFIIFYFSKNISHFLIGEIFLGIISVALITNVAILTECVSSKNRGIFLTMKSATFFWGILVANAVGTFFHWQYIVVIGLVCTIYTLVNVIIWPESPLWLATKGRIEECSAAHRWYKGKDLDSEKELFKLIDSHENNRFVEQKWNLKYLLATVRRKQFVKFFLLSSLLLCNHCFSGKVVCIMFALDILKKITNEESAAYSGMLILDGVTVAGMYIGCILSRVLRRRVLLIGFNIVGIITMILISIYLYLAQLSVIEENKYLSIFLLATYSIAISCGPMLLATTISGELLPLDCRILCLGLNIVSYKLTYGTMAKIFPHIFKNLGLHGAFALFAVLSIGSVILIYLYLPETKDRTLHEIDDYMKGGEKGRIEENRELIKIN